jgi:hypothetical protein
MKPLNQIEPRTALIPGPIPIGADYRVLIDQPGTYYLTGDITSTFRHAIKIAASHVTVDLNGFQVYSSWTPPTMQNQDFDGIYIAGGCENIEIRNGSIVSDTAEGKKGFRYGIYSEQTTSQVRLSNVRIVGSRQFGICLCGPGSEVVGCTVWKNGSGIGVAGKGTVQYCRVFENTTVELDHIYGIFGGGENRIVGNLVFGNGADAFDISSGIWVGFGSIVQENVVGDNGEECFNLSYGIWTGDGCVIKDCTVSGNGLGAGGSTGIFASGPGSVLGCAVYYNGLDAGGESAGIFARDGSTLKNNIVHGNGWGSPFSCGIYASYYSLLDGNTSCDNAGSNLYADATCLLGLNLAP